MDRTISTKDLKSKLDQRKVTVVETLAPERYREAHISGALAQHDDHYLHVAGRLKPGVTPAAAQSEMKVVAQRLQQQFPVEDKERDLYLSPLTAVLLGDQKPMLWMLLASVGFLLLIACANIANLQLARARTRRKEIAVRAALGASAKRIARQLLVESIGLGGVGGMVGVLLAYEGVAWIAAHGPASVPRLDQSTVDAVALAYACGVTLLSALCFGIAPALVPPASTRTRQLPVAPGGFSRLPA